MICVDDSIQSCAYIGEWEKNCFIAKVVQDAIDQFDG
jgi:hypothetical protein